MVCSKPALALAGCAATVCTVKETTESVTATGGAEPLLGVADDVSASSAPSPDEVLEEEEEETPEYRDTNKSLRRDFLACNAALALARAAGDTAQVTAVLSRRARIAEEFASTNMRLASRVARPWRGTDWESNNDHVAEAREGLWEAFVGTKAEHVDMVRVDPDGSIHAASGYDPDRGAFSTYAMRYINGRVRRSVNRSENTFTGLSYATFTVRPRVLAARDALHAETGTNPSAADVAARAKVTLETARACLMGSPARLDRKFGDDDDERSLGSQLAAQVLTPSTDLEGRLEAALLENMARMDELDVAAALLAHGMTDLPPRTNNQIGDVLGVGRGTVQLAIRRGELALLPPLAVPAPVVCSCAASFAYDPSGEPDRAQIVDDLGYGPEWDPDPRLFQAAQARWDREFETQVASAMAAHRHEQRVSALRFVTLHRGKRHEIIAGDVPEFSPVPIAVLLPASR